MSVIFLGYDPGGHKRHGVAYIDDNNTSVCATVESAEASVLWFMERCRGFEHVVMGVGTLTLWSTCAESWRPADRQLRESYPQLAQLVQSPNNLRGAMIINGALVMRILSENVTSLRITETHPRLLYNVLSGQIYHYQGNTAIEMSDRLQEWIGVNGIGIDSEDAWDALFSAYVAREWYDGRWNYDIHLLPANQGERLVPVIGKSAHYLWPKKLECARSVSLRQVNEQEREDSNIGEKKKSANTVSRNRPKRALSPFEPNAPVKPLPDVGPLVTWFYPPSSSSPENDNEQ